MKKQKENWDTPESRELFKAILALKTLSEAKKFFRDLLTEKEIIEFSQRWKVARMLIEKVPYEKIAEETGMSSRTIARVQSWLQDGMGGYKLMIKRLKKKKK